MLACSHTPSYQQPDSDAGSAASYRVVTWQGDSCARKEHIHCRSEVETLLTNGGRSPPPWRRPTGCHEHAVSWSQQVAASRRAGRELPPNSPYHNAATRRDIHPITHHPPGGQLTTRIRDNARSTIISSAGSKSHQACTAKRTSRVLHTSCLGSVPWPAAEHRYAAVSLSAIHLPLCYGRKDVLAVSCQTPPAFRKPPSHTHTPVKSGTLATTLRYVGRLGIVCHQFPSPGTVLKNTHTAPSRNPPATQYTP